MTRKNKMETVEVVIKILKDRYETLVELNNRIKKGESIYKLGMYENAIANGIPLPEGHGRLIDADALEIKNLALSMSHTNIWGVAPLDIDNASTILEADKEN